MSDKLLKQSSSARSWLRHLNDIERHVSVIHKARTGGLLERALTTIGLGLKAWDALFPQRSLEQRVFESGLQHTKSKLAPLIYKQMVSIGVPVITYTEDGRSTPHAATLGKVRNLFEDHNECEFVLFDNVLGFMLRGGKLQDIIYSRSPEVLEDTIQKYLWKRS
jgi:hypothetical protein